MSSGFASAVAAAAFTAVAFLTWRERVNGKVLENKEYEVEKKHVDVLNELAAKYCVKSIDKVVRIAAQYAITEGTKDKAVLDEIWHEKNTRCKTCGTKDKKKTVLKLYGKQHAFLEQIKDDYKLASKDKALRCLLEYCEALGQGKSEAGLKKRDLIFETKNARCKNC